MSTAFPKCLNFESCESIRISSNLMKHSLQVCNSHVAFFFFSKSLRLQESCTRGYFSLFQKDEELDQKNEMFTLEFSHGTLQLNHCDI